MGAEAEAGAEAGAVPAATPWSTLYKDPRGQYSAAMLGGLKQKPMNCTTLGWLARVRVGSRRG